jgi:hypothetical protein
MINMGKIEEGIGMMEEKDNEKEGKIEELIILISRWK